MTEEIVVEDASQRLRFALQSMIPEGEGSVRDQSSGPAGLETRDFGTTVTTIAVVVGTANLLFKVLEYVQADAERGPGSITMRREGRSVEITGHDSQSVEEIAEALGLDEFLNE